MYAQTADDIECPDAWLLCRKRYSNGLIWVLVFLPDGVKNTVTYAVATSAKSSYSILCLLLLSFSKNPFLGTVFNLLANLYARITNLKKGLRQQKRTIKCRPFFVSLFATLFHFFHPAPSPIIPLLPIYLIIPIYLSHWVSTIPSCCCKKILMWSVRIVPSKFCYNVMNTHGMNPLPIHSIQLITGA